MRLLHVRLGRRSRGDIPLHRHDHQEWHFIVAGPCSFRIADRVLRLTGGDGFVIAPGVDHQVLFPRPGDRIVQYLATAQAENPAEESLPRAFAARVGARGVLPAGSAMHCILAEATRLRRDGDPFAWRAIEGAFTAMVCRLVSDLGEDGPIDAVHRALDLMRQRLCIGLSMRELARHAGVSPDRLARLFRQRLGVAPSQHFLHLRLSLADELLARPGASVGAVAAAVGFADPFHFSRRYRAWSGQPPSRRLGPGG